MMYDRHGRQGSSLGALTRLISLLQADILKARFLSRVVNKFSDDSLPLTIISPRKPTSLHVT